MSPTLELTRELVSRQTVSPGQRLPELLISRLEPLGFAIERMRFGEVDNFGPCAGR
jgi:succinyl-diaminopimelate desuccinylase